MELPLFLLFAALALASAVAVILHPDPVRALMGLVVTFACTAVLFVLLGAPFLAALQILIGTGSMLVLFVIVSRALDVPREHTGPAPVRFVVGILTLALATVFGALLGRAESGAAPTSEGVSVSQVAGDLVNRHRLPLGLVGLILLVALVGAILHARRGEA